jgi:alkanesulfonate monooxygenase SsuD/methylene tetrahydromethanopterin reductase-like flavin-dependent oxidoreductase (luciferase family)
MLLGGTSDATFRRMTEHGIGWISGGGGPPMFAAGADRARAAWREAGRDGQPRLAALAYVSLGEGARDYARRYLLDYYAFLGNFAGRIADGALTSEAAVQETAAAFADAGCDELILFPCSADVTQVDLIAGAAIS